MTPNNTNHFKNTPKTKFWNWTLRDALGYGLILTISLVFLYVATKKTIENFRLAKSGTLTKAIVVDKQKVGGKGTTDLRVRYYIDNRQFEGSVTNETWNVSDTVDILYLSTDPSVIRSYDFIKENYSTDIKLK
jgi:hypothetical protein